MNKGVYGLAMYMAGVLAAMAAFVFTGWLEIVTIFTVLVIVVFVGTDTELEISGVYEEKARVAEVPEEDPRDG